MAVDFDRLNRETHEWNMRNCHRNIGGADCANREPIYGSAEWWANLGNNQTYKANNGQHSNHYTYH